MNTQTGDKLYEIRIKEHLGKNSLFCPEDFSVTYGSDGETILCGPISDQAALHGILSRICSMGLTLTLFRKLENGGTEQ